MHKPNFLALKRNLQKRLGNLNILNDYYIFTMLERGRAFLFSFQKIEIILKNGNENIISKIVTFLLDRKGEQKLSVMFSSFTTHSKCRVSRKSKTSIRMYYLSSKSIGPSEIYFDFIYMSISKLLIVFICPNVEFI